MGILSKLWGTLKHHLSVSYFRYFNYPYLRFVKTIFEIILRFRLLFKYQQVYIHARVLSSRTFHSFTVEKYKYRQPLQKSQYQNDRLLLNSYYKGQQCKYTELNIGEYALIFLTKRLLQVHTGSN